ncbi:MAG TPA: glycosyltransferase family 39 protein, partial [Pyrinomonadaceae bacterium]
DEIATVIGYVRLPAHEIMQRYETANNHVMNSLLAHASAAIWGERPWAIRLPSIIFGIAGVWAFYFLARQIWAGRMALLGTFMFAVSYHHVYYTQNARGYSAFVFFALLATGLLLRLLRTDATQSTLRYAVAYTVAVGLGMYALLLMVFVVLGHGCVLLLARRWGALGWLLAGIALALLLYAPMTQSLIAYFSERPSETGQLLFSTAFAREIKPIVLLLVVGAIVMPALLWRLARRQPLAAGLLVLPLMFNIVVPAWRGQGMHPRSLIYGLPVAYFFLMEGMDWARLRSRWIPWIVVSVVTIVSLVMLGRYYPLPKQGFQQALTYIAAHRGPTDNRIGLTLGGKAARFYDPSLVLIEDSGQLHQWLKTAHNPTWILYTFENDMRQSAPELYDWLMTATTHQATFPGVIGDGAVHVRLWLPDNGGTTGNPTGGQSD